jgi:hypothetical protein
VLDSREIVFRLPVEARDFSLPLSVQACSGAYLVSYSFCSGVRRPEHDADYSNVEVRNGWRYAPTYCLKVVMIMMMIMMIIITIIIE